MDSHIAFLTSKHPRCGLLSPAQIFDNNMCRKIIKWTININDYIEEKTFLNINNWINKINKDQNNFIEYDDIKLCVVRLYLFVNSKYNKNKIKKEINLLRRILEILICNVMNRPNCWCMGSDINSILCATNFLLEQDT
jgi:hypothetical protein